MKFKIVKAEQELGDSCPACGGRTASYRLGGRWNSRYGRQCWTCRVIFDPMSKQELEDRGHAVLKRAGLTKEEIGRHRDGETSIHDLAALHGREEE